MFNDNNWQIEKIRANNRSREQKTLELSNKKRVDGAFHYN